MTTQAKSFAPHTCCIALSTASFQLLWDRSRQWPSASTWTRWWASQRMALCTHGGRCVGQDSARHYLCLMCLSSLIGLECSTTMKLPSSISEPAPDHACNVPCLMSRSEPWALPQWRLHMQRLADAVIICAGIGLHLRPQAGGKPF